MFHSTYSSCNEAFIDLAINLRKYPHHKSSPRGLETSEIVNASIQITNPYDRIITNIHRKLSLRYLIGEWLWHERASNSLEEIASYSKFWNNVSDDNKTVKSCYGKKIYDAQETLSQWSIARSVLENDPDSRRAVLLICDKNDLSLTSKDIPCTMYLQFFIRDNKLCLISNMRSNDLVFGFSYDIATFTLFQEKMLLELQHTYPELEIGTFTHYANSLHVYAKHYKMLDKIIDNKNDNVDISMPKMKNLDAISILIYNEMIIRNDLKQDIRSINDEFCMWCQDVLINNTVNHGEFAL